MAAADAPSAATVTGTVVVGSVSTFTAVEGQPFSNQQLTTFTGSQPLSSYKATIDWGDGTVDNNDSNVTITSNGSGGFTVFGNHTYKEESAADHAGSNPYVVKVTVTDSNTTVTTTATVTDPAVAGQSVNVNAVEGAQLTNVTVATFTDPGTPAGEVLSDYSVVSINWGDGTATDTSSGAISGPDSSGKPPACK
jgi:hypothetical protein